MATTKRTLTVLCVLALYVAGIFWWWPLAALSIIVAALVAPFAGILLALLLDILWGVPAGVLHNLYFPWTLLAVLMALTRYLAPRFFFSRGSDTL